MNDLKKTDLEIFELVEKEVNRQQTSLELIASENFTSPSVMEAQGTVLTNKYAEGYPGKRWYNGCEYYDSVETIAIERAKKLFGAEFVNVQPHSGAQANMAVCMAVLKPGDTILSLDLAHGGHLSHGHKLNFSGRYFNVISYGVDKNTEMIDYDVMEDLAKKNKPKLIISGASAYPRVWDFTRMQKIAESVGALHMSDIAHVAGLIAAGIHPSPVGIADFVTTTTHKTLRGPRGGLIMCKEKYAKDIDTAVFPGTQGGPLMHVICAKAVALGEALKPEFKEYQKQVIKNAKHLADELKTHGLRIVSGGTDNHLMLVDLRSKNVTGKDAANTLHTAGITVNKNLIPFDPQSAFTTSGIRIGTPAVTTRGMKEQEMTNIAELIVKVISHIQDEALIKSVRKDVEKLCKKFPLPY
jgi:glycine hydroxymethyltransferase